MPGNLKQNLQRQLPLLEKGERDRPRRLWRGLIQLAGFALSVFNRNELTSIRNSLEVTQTENKYVASKVTGSLY